MKTKFTSQSAFFHRRVLIGFVLCSNQPPPGFGWIEQICNCNDDEGGRANPAPLINQPLVPDAVAPRGAGFTLTVNGTGFVPVRSSTEDF